MAHGALISSNYAESSVLGSGRWVKIKVSESGMHQITHEQLRSMGFSSPEKVRVYGYPATIASDYRLTSSLPDDLPQVPSVTHGDKLIFYGEGDVNLSLGYSAGSIIVKMARNYYADYGVYFLSDSGKDAAPSSIEFTPSESEPVATSHGIGFLDEEIENPGELGARFFGVDFRKTPVQNFSLSMPGYAGNGTVNMQFCLGVQPVNTPAQAAITLPDGHTVYAEKIAVDERAYFYSDLSVSAAMSEMPKTDNDIYTATIDFSSASSLGYGALDYITVSYPRDNTLGTEVQGMFAFTDLNTAQSIEFDGSGRQLMAWDITDRRNVRLFDTQRTADGKILVSAPADYNISNSLGNTCLYVQVFDPDAQLPGVESLGTVSNQNLHASDTPHMLIVTAKNFLTQAERLAELHRRFDGIDVVVALQDEVYNEFSSGTPHIMAIRRLARMYRDRDPEKFRSILLFGEARYDNRGLTSSTDPDFRDVRVPIFVCEDMLNAGNHNSSYATDAFVGMLDENYSQFLIQSARMSVNVSRIPASTQSAADAYVNKVEKYLRAPVNSPAPARAFLLSDDGDSNGHLYDADSLARVIGKVSPVTTIYRGYNSLYPWDGIQPSVLNRRIVTMLAHGVSYMSYSGHSGPNGIGGNIWTSLMAADQKSDVYPFVVFSSCRTLHIDHEGMNLGTTMLCKDDGGAIAVVGSLREVFKDYNQVLNLALGEMFFSAYEGTSTGDVFRRARNKVVEEARKFGGNRLVYNTLCYNMIGDPEIMLHVPDHKVALSAVNGRSLTGTEERIDIDPETKVVFEGAVSDYSGKVADTFNGKVYITLYDTPKEVPVLNGSPVENVTIDEDIIFEKTVTVKNGRFKTSAYLPVSSNPGEKSRLVLYAVSDDSEHKADGVHNNLCIADITGDTPTDESNVPVISAMYLNDTDFTEGDITSGNVTLYAEVAPNEIGVTGSCTLIGKSLTLTLDKSTSYDVAPYFTTSEEGGGTLVFPMSQLSDGRHQLTLKVANYAGQVSTRTIAFTVINHALNASLTVEEYPASTEANIHLTHNMNEVTHARISIRNALGDVVFASEAGQTVSFPFRWDLRDSNGKDVPDGAYYIDAYLGGNGRYGSVRDVEIIVNRD